ncbi:hypothetical protein BDF14DRAFT_1827320 [Spinellus fusiger]|nr:hypothetical protein BDF14DRAFT_1827320 [Spinellus fusiger]
MQTTLNGCVPVVEQLQPLLESDMECAICCTRFYEPSTTPCGHTFCRPCLVRSFDHQRNCPVCRETLVSVPPPTQLLCDWVSLLYNETSHDHEVQVIEQDDTIPIFMGALTFPHNRCVMHIFEPRYQLMLRRVMASSRRRFAMCLARPRQARAPGEGPFYEYGTMLELTHVQTLPDGRSIVEAVGSHRFKVLEHTMVDGYPVGKIERVDDMDAEQEQAQERRQIMTASAMRARQQQQTLQQQVQQQAQQAMQNLQQQQQQQQQAQQQAQRPQPQAPRPFSPFASRPPQAAAPSSGGASSAPTPFSPARPFSPMARTPAIPGAASGSATLARPALAMGQRQSWAARAHPQTQTAAKKSPWIQMHLQGLSAAQPKPQKETPTLVVVPSAASVKSKEEETTDSLLDQLATFVETILAHQRATPTDRFSQWLNALGSPPVVRGPQRDRVIFTWWVANMVPLSEDEKKLLLTMTSVRERVLAITHWIDKFKDQWSYWLQSKDQLTSIGAGSSCNIS